MNKSILSALPLTLILAVCASYAGTTEVSCAKDVDPSAPCLGDPRVPTVNLKLKKLETAPACVRVRPGTTLIFRLTPKKDLEHKSVEISPKDEDDDWLEGDNSEYTDLIIIKIPDDLEPGDYEYSIRTATCFIDPRVHVEH